MNSIFSFRSFLYLVYAVVLTAVLLYVRFPAEKFKTYCEKRIEQVLPGSVCRIDRVGYRFPASASFETITISRPIDGQQAAMTVDRIDVTPEPLQFWKDFKLKGEIYSGLFEADLHLDSRTQTFSLSDIYLDGIDAGEFAAGIGLTDRKVTGVMAYSGTYQGKNSQPGDGTGNGLFQIEAGSMTLLQPILSLSSIEFEKLAFGVIHEEGVLRLVEGELLGKEVVADFTGDVKISSPLLHSNILLSGHLEPDGDFLRSNPEQQQVVQQLLQRYKMTVLPFKVGGTLKRPLFRFSM
ncbi:MAG: type II secretion system protein GspN [Desulforhopalus sp.]